MKKFYFILIFILSLNSCIVSSQPVFPPNTPVFDSSVVARIEITINPDTLQWIYENLESDIEFRADMIFSNVTIRDTLAEIGFRLGGNTSRYSEKKSFNLDFNQFRAGQKFQGLKMLNLNSNHNDPSATRGNICWEMLRSFGVPAPRAAHTEVFINGSYYGIYSMVEQIDEEFLESRFGNKDGNLFKCLWPADLAYLGEDPNLYKFISGDRQTYDLRTNQEADDYSDFANFIDVLNNTPEEDLVCELEKVFNLKDYLKAAAMDIMIGNWDGYIYNKNNFYVYHNTATGKFEFIPYDLDNTLGVDWLDRDWGIRDIYDWEQHGTEVRPLYTRLMGNQEIRDQYSFYFRHLLDMLANEDSLFAAIYAHRDLIGPSVADDPYYPRTYGFTYDDFLDSFDSAWGGHVDYGIIPYIQTRKSSASQQLVVSPIIPVVKYLRASDAVPGNIYWVRAFVEDDDPAPSVKLVYRINNGFSQFLQMTDTGEQHDYEPGDGYYGCTLPVLQLNSTLQWQVQVTDNSGNTILFPCDPVYISLAASQDPQLFINELMCNNDTTIADEYSEYDNWAEIFNGDDEAVFLGDKYLSDNLANPNKWKMPDVTMQPGTFVIIWADGQPEQGPFHASYKLNDEGEQLGIFDNETTGYFLIDSVSWGMQTIDVSWGRKYDADPEWVFFTQPTPGYSNGTNSIIEYGGLDSRLIAYPNPLKDDMLYFGVPFSGFLTDLTGRKVWEGYSVLKADLHGIPAGMYIVSDTEGHWAKVLVP